MFALKRLKIKSMHHSGLVKQKNNPLDAYRFLQYDPWERAKRALLGEYVHTLLQYRIPDFTA